MGTQLNHLTREMVLMGTQNAILYSSFEYPYFLSTHNYETVPQLLYDVSVVVRKYFTCPSRELNPGRWIYRQTLYQYGLFTLGAIVVERKYFTCPSHESNPGCWIHRQTLYHVTVKAGFYCVLYIPIDPVTLA